MANKKKPTQSVGLKILASEDDCQNLRDMKPQSSASKGLRAAAATHGSICARCNDGFQQKIDNVFCRWLFDREVEPESMASSIASQIDFVDPLGDELIGEFFLVIIPRLWD